MWTASRARWIELALVALVFGALAATVELAGISRALLLPAWVGLTLAFAAGGACPDLRTPSR